MDDRRIDQAKVSEAVKRMIDLLNGLGMNEAEKLSAAEALARSAREVAVSADVGIRTA